MWLLELLKKIFCKEAIKEPLESDREQNTARMVTARDMVQFTQMPYDLDCNVKQSGEQGQISLAYIDLDQQNAAVALDELAKINPYLAEAHHVCRKVPKGLCIPTEDIILRPHIAAEYTRLICTPYTPTGKISKYPLYLYFCTDTMGENTTHGQLYYGQNGCVQKALVCCWRNHKGYFFYFKTENNSLVLSKIEMTGSSGMVTAAYKRPSAKLPS